MAVFADITKAVGVTLGFPKLLDATLVAAVQRDQVVTIGTPDSNGAVALAALGDSVAVAVGHGIIYQSDMTLERGHVPVERMSYAPSDTVAASSTAKKVNVIIITDNILPHIVTKVV